MIEIVVLLLCLVFIFVILLMEKREVVDIGEVLVLFLVLVIFFINRFLSVFLVMEVLGRNFVS